MEHAGAAPDPYEVLGVARSATQEDIKAAYRRLSKTAHPDRGGSAALFRIIQTAYDTLTDPGYRPPVAEQAAPAGAGQQSSSRPTGGRSGWEDNLRFKFSDPAARATRPAVKVPFQRQARLTVSLFTLVWVCASTRTSDITDRLFGFDLAPHMTYGFGTRPGSFMPAWDAFIWPGAAVAALAWTVAGIWARRVDFPLLDRVVFVIWSAAFLAAGEWVMYRPVVAVIAAFGVPAAFYLRLNPDSALRFKGRRRRADTVPVAA